MTEASQPKSFRVAALYRFCRLAGFAALKPQLAGLCRDRGIKGTLLLAPEGVNGTVAGTETAIAELVEYLESIPEFAGLEVKYSIASAMPFRRMKVRLKREIVAMGVAGIDPRESAGTYVEPVDWNALIADPGTVVIDTRNDYEVALGSFAGAVAPGTQSFSEFPAWVEAHRNELRGKRIAMFCTGGIRCEKATAYVKSLGLQGVFHLKGGILKYLERVPPQESLWRGECFVFDERVSVGHGLDEGEAELCRACRRPLTAAERLSPRYRRGISCPHCFETRTEADRARYAERHRQLALAEARGAAPHIGS
jgi:UPF0176 protein